MLEKRSNLILTQALLVSGGLNVFFIGTFFFIMVQEAPLYFSLREAKATSTKAKHNDSNAAQILTQLQTLPLDELTKRLDDNTSIEEGFQTRDFALALLVQKYHFDLNRAILGLQEPKQKKSFKIASNDSIHLLDLYSDLNEHHFKAIVDFAKIEKWPLTPDGLFLALKDHPEDISLKQAFMHSHLFATLASHSDDKPEDLLAALLKQDSLTTLPKVSKAPLPEKTLVEKSPEKSSPEKPTKSHVVQEGESLWRISRLHKIDIALLKSHNHLHSDQIRPGQTLLIP